MTFHPIPTTAQKFKSLPNCVHSMQHRKISTTKITSLCNAGKSQEIKKICIPWIWLTWRVWQPYAESRLVTSAGCRFHRWSEPRIHHRATLAEQRAAHTRPRCGVWRIIANVRRRSWRRCTRGLAREETCELGSKVEDGAGDVTAGDY